MRYRKLIPSGTYLKKTAGGIECSFLVGKRCLHISFIVYLSTNGKNKLSFPKRGCIELADDIQMSLHDILQNSEFIRLS